MPKRPGSPLFPSPKTPRTPSNTRGYFGTRTADTPIASPRPTRIGRASGRNVTILDAQPIRWRDPGPGRWLSFGRVYRTQPPSRGSSAMSMAREWDRGDSAGAFSTPDSTPAPTESYGSYSRSQAFEIDTPMAVPESTGWAFSTAFVEFFVISLIMHVYSKFVKDKPDFVDKALSDFDKWIRKYLRLPDRPKKVPHTVISGTPQPKATCHPGYPNSFTHALGSPLASPA